MPAVPTDPSAPHRGLGEADPHTAPPLDLTLSPLAAGDRKRLALLYDAIRAYAETFVGYPCNENFDYSPLYPFLAYPINNVGDPFAASTYRVNTREIERDVLEWFAELYHAEPGSYWGYVTNGGTEGNMYGLYLARELYPDGILYFSQDRHYSIDKIARVLNIEHHMIRSDDAGEMDYEDLDATLALNRDRPAIVLANIGSTMRQAVDSVSQIRACLEARGISRRYIHCDAALAGMILPFVDDAPEFDFRAGIDSLSVSGHKMVGSPMPCGIVLVRKEHVARVATSVEYVGIMDTTLTGSRNGFSPLMLWYAIHSKTHAQLRAMVAECMAVADYAVERLRAMDVPAWRHAHGITVVFPRPAKDVLEKWQIAVENDICHIIAMPHVDRALIDRLAADIARARVGRVVKQITIYTADKPGILAEVAGTLAEAGVDIETFDGETIGDRGILILTVDRYYEAVAALRQAGFELVDSEAFLLRLPARPGALAELAKRFKDASVNIKSLRLVGQEDGFSLAAMTTDNAAEAIELVRDVMIA